MISPCAARSRVASSAPDMKRSHDLLAHPLACALALAVLVATPKPADAADAAPPVLRGSVVTRDNVRLPDDAEVIVRILDDTKPNAPVLVAETTITTAGRQPPIPFTLPIDPVKVTGKRHSLHAVIRYGGKTRYVTGARIVVNPEKLPESLSMLVRPGEDEPDFSVAPMPTPTGRIRPPGS